MEYLFLRRKKTSGTSVRQKALLYRAAGREWTVLVTVGCSSGRQPYI